VSLRGRVRRLFHAVIQSTTFDNCSSPHSMHLSGDELWAVYGTLTKPPAK
jgi:hypothetical protein